MPEYKVPKCNKCGKDIGFVSLRFHDGTIKSVPVEAKFEYIITPSGDKDEKGRFIWQSLKRAIPHNCTAKETLPEDKPPF
jgi:hypothetical protein